MTTITGPTTKAGSALLEALSNLAADLPLEFGDEPLERLDMAATMELIVNIEREAAEPATAAVDPPNPVTYKNFDAGVNVPFRDERATAAVDVERLRVAIRLAHDEIAATDRLSLAIDEPLLIATKYDEMTNAARLSGESE